MALREMRTADGADVCAAFRLQRIRSSGFREAAEVARIKLPEEPGGSGVAEGRTGTPSQRHRSRAGREIIVGERGEHELRERVFAYSLPKLAVDRVMCRCQKCIRWGTRRRVRAGMDTFTPDSQEDLHFKFGSRVRFSNRI